MPFSSKSGSISYDFAKYLLMFVAEGKEERTGCLLGWNGAVLAPPGRMKLGH